MKKLWGLLLLSMLTFFSGASKSAYGQALVLEGTWVFQKAELKEHPFGKPNVISKSVEITKEGDLNMGDTPFGETVLSVTFYNESAVEFKLLALPSVIGNYRILDDELFFAPEGCVGCEENEQQQQLIEAQRKVYQVSSSGNTLQLTSKYSSSSEDGPVECEYTVTLHKEK